MGIKDGLLNSIKRDVEKAGSNRGKIFFVGSGNKSRIRFLNDMDDGNIISFHDRWEPSLNVPCEKNFNEDAECPYCDQEGIRTRDMYCWSIWDYDNNEVKLFMYAANNCSPVPSLVAMFENYGTLIDRDFSISRSGKGTDTSYTLVPLDKGQFRNTKAKPYSLKALLKIVHEAYPGGEDADDGINIEGKDYEDEEEEKPVKASKKPATASKPKEKDNTPWDDEDSTEDYDAMTAIQLYNLCKERDIVIKPRLDKDIYIAKLSQWDATHDDGDEDFWGDEK